MLFMLWLRSYPCYTILPLLFDVSPANVIDSLLPIFNNTYVRNVQWSSALEWGNMRGIWEDLSDAVGVIGGTSHQIYRPQTEPQALHYSGHRHYHCIRTIVIR